MHGLSSTEGIVALAAGGVAVVALLACLALAISLRRLRAHQRTVLGEGDSRDLVGHAVELQQAFTVLRDYVDDVAQRLDARLASAEAGVDGSISHRALVRYDAYNEMSGHQSMSIALLDASHSGIVLTSIHHRDQARLYAKQVLGGKTEYELSPEEAEAIALAVSGQVQQIES